MKQRRTVIISFLLVAVMLLGVGYAAVADPLEITGALNVSKTAVEKELEDDVYFVEDSASVVSNESGLTASCSLQSVAKPDIAYMTVNAFDEIGQTVTFQYQVKNASTTKAVLAKLTIAAGDAADYITFDVKWGATDDALTAGVTNDTCTIAADGTIYVQVTATLKGIGNDAASFTNFKISLDCSYVA